MKVKCIDASGWAKSRFTVGKIYPVLNADSTCYYLTDDKGITCWTYQSRFQKVSSEEKEDPIVSEKTNKEYSLYDLFSQVPPGYCKCNMLKSQCTYHKD